MRTPRLVAGGLLLALLAGCSSSLLQGKKIDYRSAGEAPGLEVPPDLTRPGADDRFSVPDVNRGGTATASEVAQGTVQTQGSTAAVAPLPKVNKVGVERAGNDRWLVVEASPDQLWLPVKDFWQELGFILKIEEPETGIMETDWAENRASIPDDFIRNSLGKLFDSIYSTDERDKFRTRMERRADGKTEIYITHRGMYEAYTESKTKTGGTGQTVWQPRPRDPELEAEMLTRLMVRLGVEEQTARQQLATNKAPDRAKLMKSGDAGEIVSYEPFDRAWRRVGLVLDRTGFTVVDRNRQDGIYFVSYTEEKKPESSGGGFFDWLFGSSDKPKANETIQYRVVVRPDGDNAKVTVQNKDGKPENTPIGGKILALLYDQLR